MPKTPDEITPNFGPVYAAALYPGLATIAQAHGYALAVHGSLARDFDLIAVPWAESVSDPQEVLQEMIDTFTIRLCGEGEERAHGRKVFMLSVGFGTCSVDLSFLPAADSTHPP